MGPSVKLVLPIIDAFPDQRNKVILCVAKKDKLGGPRGGLSGGQTFSRLSFWNISLIHDATFVSDGLVPTNSCHFHKAYGL